MPVSRLALALIVSLSAVWAVPAAGAQQRGGAGQYEARLDVPPPPNPPRLVNDLAGLLNAGEQRAIEQKLVAFSDSTSSQIVVLIVRSTNGQDPGEYATEVLRSWGVGQAGADNGVVFLIALDDRQTFIATGLGAEGPLPDALAGRIVRDIVVPRFRQNLFFAGIDEATDVMMRALAGEDFEAAPMGPGGGGSLGGVMCLLFIVFVLLILMSARHGGPGSGTRSASGPGRRRGPRVVVLPGFGGGFGGGGFGGGGFGGGGFGGGGFGGFGGGFGGGGGAGGGW